jgi:hypothetical protein
MPVKGRCVESCGRGSEVLTQKTYVPTYITHVCNAKLYPTLSNINVKMSLKFLKILYVHISN